MKRSDLFISLALGASILAGCNNSTPDAAPTEDPVQTLKLESSPGPFESIEAYCASLTSDACAVDEITMAEKTAELPINGTVSTASVLVTRGEKTSRVVVIERAGKWYELAVTLEWDAPRTRDHHITMVSNIEEAELTSPEGWFNVLTLSTITTPGDGPEGDRTDADEMQGICKFVGEDLKCATFVTMTGFGFENKPEGSPTMFANGALTRWSGSPDSVEITHLFGDPPAGVDASKMSAPGIYKLTY